MFVLFLALGVACYVLLPTATKAVLVFLGGVLASWGLLSIDTPAALMGVGVLVVLWWLSGREDPTPPAHNDYSDIVEKRK